MERTGPEDQLYQPPYINMPGQAGHPFINDRDHCETYFAENFPEVARFREKLYQRQVRSIAERSSLVCVAEYG